MSRIRITKEFNFEMAHALWNYNGLCRNIHGHSYKLFVTLIGEPVRDQSNSCNGMIMDFGELKSLVKQNIIDYYDHSLVLFESSPSELLTNVRQMFDKFHVVSFQPTCENLVIDIAGRIRKELPAGLNLFSIRLNETATAFAEWYASDNT